MEEKPPPLPPLRYSPEEMTELARQWTKSMWNASLWKQVRWLGVPVLQWPTDLILMQELIAESRPRVIVETGLYLGGTAVYYASLLDLLGIDGRVISIDIQIHPEALRNIDGSRFRDRIRWIEGDSKSDAVHAALQRQLAGESNVLVCLDSDHSYAHTLGELRAFARYVPAGSYMVLFDTICEDLADTPNGEPAWKQDNPMAALRQFLTEHPNFATDQRFGKYLVSFAPQGFLKRIS
ncbi:MAG: class I SAM-dependent methyltransferase [Acidobacteria bacterium]|nr:class I SAM-dependent methyltransferase [Acidobacteriota bacterium]